MLCVLGCKLNQGSFTAPVDDLSGNTIVLTGPTISGIGYETSLARATLVYYPLLTTSSSEQRVCLLLKKNDVKRPARARADTLSRFIFFR